MGALLDVYTFVLLVAMIVVVGNALGFRFPTDNVNFSLINLIVSLLLVVVVPIDFLIAGLTPSRRSLSMRITRTRFATRESVRVANRSEVSEATA